MTIKFTTSPPTYCRIISFIDHFKQLGYSVIVDNEENYNADIWFINFFQHNPLDIKVFFNNDILKMNILKFKGKICLFSLDDACAHILNELLPLEIIERIDGWMTSIIYSCTINSYTENIINKLILCPRYIIPYRKYVDCPKKNNLFFYGRPTSQIRIDAIKKLKFGKLKDRFIGGIIGGSEYDKLNPYNPDEIGIQWIPPSQLFEINCNNMFALCLPGHTVWTYRHLDAMQGKCAIISVNMNNDAGSWLYQDKIKDNFFYIKPDLSNLEDVYIDCVNNIDESRKRAEESHNIYKKYFEMNEDKTFNSFVWSELKESFAHKNIIFDV